MLLSYTEELYAYIQQNICEWNDIKSEICFETIRKEGKRVDRKKQDWLIIIKAGQLVHGRLLIYFLQLVILKSKKKKEREKNKLPWLHTLFQPHSISLFPLQ